MKTSYLFPLFVSAVLLAAVPAVSALESPVPSDPGSTVTENLKARLKETINPIEAEDLTGSNNIGFIGKVKDIVKNTLVVEDKSGKRNVVIGDDTQIVRTPGNASIKLDSVRIGDSVIAIGAPAQANNETQGKRIIVSDTPFNPPQKITGLARITKLSSSTVEVTSPSDNKSSTLTVTSKTIVKSPDSSLDFEELEEGDLIIFSALVDDKGKSTATVIMRIKGTGPAVGATTDESPSPSPKQSGKPSPSPKNRTSPVPSPAL